VSRSNKAHANIFYLAGSDSYSFHIVYIVSIRFLLESNLWLIISFLRFEFSGSFVYNNLKYYIRQDIF